MTLQPDAAGGREAGEGVGLISFPRGGVGVVFGAGGGIGGALLAQLGDHDRFAAVRGFGRQGTPPVDLLDEATIGRAVEAASALGPLRLVIDATGFLHDDRQGPERSWRELDGAALTRCFALNAVGPALIMKHVLERLPRDGKAVFATLSARVGSIADNRLGGWYGYRASKAALNQLVRTAAIELRRRRREAVCVTLHPGTVDTALSAPFAKDGLEVQPPALAAARLLSVLDRLGPADTGGFFDQCGRPVPW